MFGRKQKEIEQLAHELCMKTMDIMQLEIDKVYYKADRERYKLENIELKKQLEDMTMQAMAYHERYKELKHFPSGDE